VPLDVHIGAPLALSGGRGDSADSRPASSRIGW
jgi:hypothetical protein